MAKDKTILEPVPKGGLVAGKTYYYINPLFPEVWQEVLWTSYIHKKQFEDFKRWHEQGRLFQIKTTQK